MKHSKGQIEVICGPMYSGKTEELIRRVRRAFIARQDVLVFKPKLDTRSTEIVLSHNGDKHAAYEIAYAYEAIGYATLPFTGYTVIAFDEAQFFDASIVPTVLELAEMGNRVIVAGLDMDFRREPFGYMPELICRAQSVTKLSAICNVCGEEAHFTQRLINGQYPKWNDPVVVIGAYEEYQARCADHHNFYLPNGVLHNEENFPVTG